MPTPKPPADVPAQAQDRQVATTHRGGLLETETHAIVETATAAAAAQARARIEAAYVMAMRRPRDLDQVRYKLLRECERTEFAETAEYHIPRGGNTITGPTIRFAEAAAAAMGNLEMGSCITWESATQRMIHIWVVDLEANTPWSADAVIDKTVERSRLKDGQVALGQRFNSEGRTVYLVAATEDEVAQKQAVQVSKHTRTLILRVLPGDLQDAAIARARETLRARDKKDPNAARHRILDAFARLNVPPAELAEYVGHSLDRCSPAEIEHLRGIHAAVESGESTWATLLEERLAARGATAAATAKKADGLKATPPTPLRAAKPEPPAADAATRGGGESDDEPPLAATTGDNPDDAIGADIFEED